MSCLSTQSGSDRVQTHAGTSQQVNGRTLYQLSYHFSRISIPEVSFAYQVLLTSHSSNRQNSFAQSWLWNYIDKLQNGMVSTKQLRIPPKLNYEIWKLICHCLNKFLHGGIRATILHWSCARLAESAIFFPLKKVHKGWFSYFQMRQSKYQCKVFDICWLKKNE